MTITLAPTQEAIVREKIIGWYVSRWNIEVTFEEIRAHLGLETHATGVCA